MFLLFISISNISHYIPVKSINNQNKTLNVDVSDDFVIANMKRLYI